MKKFLALLMTVAMLSVCLAAFGSTTMAAEEFELNVSFAAPEFSTKGVTASLERIQEKSEGRIKFNYYYSWSLSSVPTVVDDLNSGVVDIAAVPVNEHLNLFPYSNLVTYTPFLPLNGMLPTAQAFSEMVAEYEVFQQEFDNVDLHYWTNYPCPPYHLFTTEDKAIKTPADLAGLKIITSSKPMSDFITANGGAVVNSPVTDYATNMNTHVVDGVINHLNVLEAFGCLDFIGGGTVFANSGTAMSLMVMCISKSVWDSLPEDLQAIFNEEAPMLLEEQCAEDTAMQEAAFEKLADKGVNLVQLTEEEVEAWRAQFDDIKTAYVQELVESGASEAQAIYDAFLAKIAE